MKKLFFKIINSIKIGSPEGGFNLIELGLVIMILAILMYTVIPTGEMQDTAKLMSLSKKIQAIYNAAQSCMLAHGAYDYAECEKEKTLESYLPAAAKDDSQKFWKTPWDGTIKTTTKYGKSSFQIDIDLGDTPTDTDVSYADRLGKLLQGSAKEVDVKGKTVTVVY